MRMQQETDSRKVTVKNFWRYKIKSNADAEAVAQSRVAAIRSGIDKADIGKSTGAKLVHETSHIVNVSPVYN